MSRNKITKFFVYGIIGLSFNCILVYEGYLWGKQNGIRNESSSCNDTLAEQEQKDLNECKQAVDGVIQSCETVCHEECLIEIHKSCPMIKKEQGQEL